MRWLLEILYKEDSTVLKPWNLINIKQRIGVSSEEGYKEKHRCNECSVGSGVTRSGESGKTVLCK